MNQQIEFQLYQIAENQAGYFTLNQAQTLGLARNQIYRELKRGKFEKANWGVYRFVQFPSIRFEELHVAILSAGEQAVIGFETALYVYELSDIIPDEIHLILPTNSSRRRPGIQVHTTRLNPEDITLFEGLPITTVARTITDVAFANISDEQIQLTIAQALRRGMTTRQKLLSQAVNRPERVRNLFHTSLDGIKL